MSLTSPVARIGLIAVVFVTAILVGAALNVDQKRRSLPRWLSITILVVTFSPLLLEEFGVLPWGANGVVVAVIAAFGLYIILPLVLTTVLTPAETRVDEVATPALVGTHQRSTTDEYADGIYRVVGEGETVTLLRVTDGDGKRRSTGVVYRIKPSVFEAAFEPSRNPDAGIDVRRLVRQQGTALYWSIRRHF